MTLKSLVTTLMFAAVLVPSMAYSSAKHQEAVTLDKQERPIQRFRPTDVTARLENVSYQKKNKPVSCDNGKTISEYTLQMVINPTPSRPEEPTCIDPVGESYTQFSF